VGVQTVINWTKILVWILYLFISSEVFIFVHFKELFLDSNVDCYKVWPFWVQQNETVCSIIFTLEFAHQHELVKHTTFYFTYIKLFFLTVFNVVKNQQASFEARYEVFMAVKIQIEVFWVVTLCSVLVLPSCWHGGSMDIRNVGIILQHYTMSQPRRPRLEMRCKLRPNTQTAIRLRSVSTWRMNALGLKPASISTKLYTRLMQESAWILCDVGSLRVYLSWSRGM
jgi:hypothetical protein